MVGILKGTHHDDEGETTEPHKLPDGPLPAFRLSCSGTDDRLRETEGDLSVAVSGESLKEKSRLLREQVRKLVDSRRQLLSHMQRKR